MTGVQTCALPIFPLDSYYVPHIHAATVVVAAAVVVASPVHPPDPDPDLLLPLLVHVIVNMN